jgi:hypothetical protein
MAGVLRLNESLTFGKTGKIKDLDAFGFDLSETAISWTKDEVAGFTLGSLSAPPESALRLTVAAAPFIHPAQISRQQFFVFINGLFVGFRTLPAAEKVSFAVSRNVISPRGMRFEFVIPTAVSPKSLGLSDDVRKLGIAFSDLTFSIEKQ